MIEGMGLVMIWAIFSLLELTTDEVGISIPWLGRAAVCRVGI